MPAVLYLAFVAYGSFVPLHFRPKPLEDAWHVFQHAIPAHPSRTDMAANVLLMAPFPFLLLGALPIGRSSRASALAAFSVWALSSALSVLIEFGQIYFPPRNPSLYDIACQSAGAAASVLTWLWGGPAIASAWRKWRTAYGAPAVAEWILGPYLAVLFFYNVMPLDLTASPAAVYHKWKEGRVVWVPFSRLPWDAVHALYSVVGDIVVWVPVASLLVLSGRTGPLGSILLTVAAAAGIEGIQLLVFSRVSDVTDIITAALGAVAGAWVGTVLRSRWGGLARERSPETERSWALVGLTGAVLWLVVIAALFWYPFDFHWDRTWARERLGLLARPPFQLYWSGSEFRALTEVLHKTVFFAPLGAALALAAAPIRGRRARGIATSAAIVFVAAAAAGVELGQVFLPRKIPDSTDVILMTAGGGLGFLAVVALRRKLLPEETRPPAPAPPGVPVRGPEA